MNTPALTQVLYFLDEAFAGTAWHSLLGNLESVTPADWLWVPPDGKRSIRDIVQHVGGAKLIYQNHAFGDAQLHWDDPAMLGEEAVASLPTARAWLRTCHQRLRDSVASLEDDAELLRPRRHFRGRLHETRWLINVMIQHDLYHAGEINHIRCLHQGDDE
jgi:hypothetical protein